MTARDADDPDAHTPDAHTPKAQTPDAQTLDAQTLDAQTLAALRGLPRRFREVLIAREIEGLSMEEVAARFRLSRPAAERRWGHAVMLLSERLARAGTLIPEFCDRNIVL